MTKKLRAAVGGTKFRMSLGLQNASLINCADNTGAKNLYIFGVYGWGARLNRVPGACPGDMCLGTVKKGKPDLRKKRAHPAFTACTNCCFEHGFGVVVCRPGSCRPVAFAVHFWLSHSWRPCSHALSSTFSAVPCSPSCHTAHAQRLAVGRYTLLEACQHCSVFAARFARLVPRPGRWPSMIAELATCLQHLLNTSYAHLACASCATRRVHSLAAACTSARHAHTADAVVLACWPPSQVRMRLHVHLACW